MPNSAEPATVAHNAIRTTAGAPQTTLAERIGGSRYLGLSAFLFALLQTLCPAVIALSAVRVAIGLGALAAAAGTNAPPRAWHVDAIRIPMMLIAALGAALNLFIIWHVRRLRARAAAQWRIAPLSVSKRRSERWQIALAILTFVCLAAEWITHPMMHHPH
jgi:MFS family permease